MAEERPAPESFLDLVAEQRKGRLKIYVGAAAGVGKTWRMLEEAHRACETKASTWCSASSKPIGAPTPRTRWAIWNWSRAASSTTAASPMEEMDVDAILARKPEVAVVDELAHTNVAGSKHEKRYQDIEELLAAAST